MSTERGVSFSGASVMGLEGASLPSSSFWFPRRLAPFAFYDISVSLPKGFDAVMEGEFISHKETESRSVVRYKVGVPSDGINLIAARFIVNKESYKGIDIYTYFYVDDDELSQRYIDKTKFYIDAFDALMPPYPYKKFAVVENFLPTGFGMPSFTLLGSAVLRLPFIPDTALGHEFVHNWWGNGVYIDAASGNWAEALTTYTADHQSREREGKDAVAAYRMRALSNYANYAYNSVKPVSSFGYGTSTEDRAIGYSKAMMIFHMLRSIVGDDQFYASLRRFYDDNAFTKGSWEDIRVAFEDTSGLELGWFFDQWLTRAGGPKLSIERVKLSRGSKSPYRLSFVIKQEPPFYRLTVPVLIETLGGMEKRLVTLTKGSKRVKLKLDERPLSFEVDPGSDIFRLLSPVEIPPSLATVLGNKESILVLPADVHSSLRYQLIAKTIKHDFALEVKGDTQVTQDELLEGQASYFIFGGEGENRLFDLVKERLPEGLVVGKGFFMVEGVRYDYKDSVLVAAISVGDKGRTLAILFGGLSAGELERIGQRISHLTSKGFLVFTRGAGLKHGTFEGRKSLRYEFND
ncbi:MAG: hypothetical protein IME98_00750 [Proteobacteria bacterium]|nr:hypothetical protein [Pseudomonadota bacterium]